MWQVLGNSRFCCSYLRGILPLQKHQQTNHEYIYQNNKRRTKERNQKEIEKNKKRWSYKFPGDNLDRKRIRGDIGETNETYREFYRRVGEKIVEKGGDALDDDFIEAEACNVLLLNQKPSIKRTLFSPKTAPAPSNNSA